MHHCSVQFWNDETGQDLTEYALLLAFAVLASAAMFLQAGNSMTGIWEVSNTRLALGNSVAAS